MKKDSIPHQFAGHIVGEQPATQRENHPSPEGGGTINEAIRDQRGNTPTRDRTSPQSRPGLVRRG